MSHSGHDGPSTIEDILADRKKVLLKVKDAADRKVSNRQTRRLETETSVYSPKRQESKDEFSLAGMLRCDTPGEMSSSGQLLASTEVSSSSSQKGGKKMTQTEMFARRNRTAATVNKGVDLGEVLSFRQKIKESLSIADVAESNAIPYFKYRAVGGNKYGGSLEQESMASVQTTGTQGSSRTAKTDMSGLESLSIRGSTILAEYGKYEPTGHKAFLAEKKANLDDPDVMQQIFLRATTLVIEARRSLDPSRPYFEAAATFEELAAIPKSIMYYERAVANQCPPDDIVDKVVMPWSDKLARRLLHLNRDQKKAFWDARNKERDENVFLETERQRLRILVAHCQLVRLHLLMDDTKMAHKNISNAFKKCTSAIEHLELLHYMNDVLKETNYLTTPEVSRAMQIYKGTVGPLAEAHIAILHELLEEDARDVETLRWLAKRYAEKSDFETSKQFFRRIRDLAEGPFDPDETLNRYQIRGSAESMAKSDWEAAIWKREMTGGSFSFDTDRDIKAQTVRSDFTKFPGLHLAAQTTFYLAPTQGWDPAMEFQVDSVQKKMTEIAAKLEQRKQRGKVPAVIAGKVIHPDSMQAKRMALEKESQQRRDTLNQSVQLSKSKPKTSHLG